MMFEIKRQSFRTNFHTSQNEAARPPDIFCRGLRCRYQSFDEFIRHQIQALIFGYLFIKKKVKAIRWPAEARMSVGIGANRRTEKCVP